MKAFIVLCMAAAAVSMPYGPVISSGWAAPAIAHAPIAYAQPVVKSFVQPQYAVHAAPVLHAAPVVKTIAPAASSYASFSQVHVSHPQPIVKHVVAAQPVYAQPIVKQVVAQPVYAQPLVKQVVSAHPVYAHNPW